MLAAMLLLFIVDINAFLQPSNLVNARKSSQRSLIRMSADVEGQVTRRQALNSVAGAALGLAVTAAAPQQSLALGALDRVNRDLKNQGLPTISKVPDGLTPLLEYYGRDRDGGRERYLVQFAHPSLWIVQKPSITINGEDGTVAAGDYQKGDSATLFVGEPLPAGKKISQMDKAFFTDVVAKGISQKSDNLYQNLKVKKVTPLAEGIKGSEYYQIEFKYELVTGAGFTVDRSAIAVVTAVGKNTQALICATTDKRYKKLEPVFKDMAGTFRIYDDVTIPGEL